MSTAGKVLLVRPEKNTDLFKLSVSKCKTFSSCAAKYRFSYIEKLPQKDWAHTVFGKFLHEILENFHKERIAGNSDPDHVLMTQTFHSSVKNWNEKLDTSQKKEAWGILNIYLKELLKERSEGQVSKVLSVEKEFYIDIDGKVLLNGFIDRVQEDPDGMIHVTDYKTSNSKKFLEKDFFQLQTYAYVMCLEDEKLEEVRTSYIMLRHGFDKIEKTFSRKEVMKVESKFLEYAEKIQSEKLWRASPSKLCSWCDYVGFCKPGDEFVNSINNFASFSANNSSHHGEVSWEASVDPKRKK